MRKITISIFCLLLAFVFSSYAQDKKKTEGYGFTDIKRLPTTSIKSQDRAGTCWSWSTISFLESEIIRKGKDSVSLAPLFIVWNTYDEKADKYVRMHGSMNFGQGGASADVTWAIKEYGIVPLNLYSGLQYGEDVHAHGELDAILKAYVDAVVSNQNKRLSTAWKKGYDGILNAYLGEKPEKFNWKGKEYTPKTFATEACGLNMDEYISLTSFTHHPFYEPFALEVPDNWIGEISYNIPLNEMMDVLDQAIDKGYTFSWGSDVSEIGFLREGLAVLPDIENQETSDAEITKWVSMKKEDKQKKIAEKPMKEKTVTQEMRQKEFDNYLTTDDHGMHVIGKAKDADGNPYFIVKNSWGKYGEYEGYLYASYPFVAMKTTSIMIHKDALPKELKKKLGIK